MRKIYIFIISIMLSLAFCSCNTKPNDSTTKPNEEKTPEVTGDILELGYGDYVRYVDKTKNSSTLKNEYEKLQKKVTNQINSNIVSTYEQGLLNFFNINYKIDLNVKIEQSELEKLNHDNEINNRESYRICDLDITINGLIFHYEDVGIRQKGNTSRGDIIDKDGNIYQRHYKLSLTETFDDEFTTTPIKWTNQKELEYREKRDFFGLEKLNLRWNRNQDSTYIKEYYAFEMYRNNGVLAPHSNPVHLTMTINNESQNLGVYLAVEDINKKFLQKNLSEKNQGGDLYKLGWTNSGATLDSVNANDFGSEYQIKDGDRYKLISFKYDLKTNKSTSEHLAFKNFINKIISTSSNEFNKFLEENTIYDSLINYLSISYLLGDPDDLRGNFNNTYIYFTPENKALFIPTDNDRVLGSTGGTGNPTGHHGALNKPFDNHTGYSTNSMAFFNKSIVGEGNSTTKENYLNSIKKIINDGWFELETFTQYYTKCKNNYGSLLTLGSKVNGGTTLFSLTESNDLADGWNLSVNVYFETKKQVINSFDPSKELNKSSLYLRGTFNNWEVLDEYNLNIIDGVPTIEIYISNEDRFKIANNDWSADFHFDTLIDNSLCNSVGSHLNIQVKESGIYIIEIINYNLDNAYLSITKK